MDYRERFYILRKKHGLRQEDIAEICGTSKNNVGHWEHMRHDIPIDNICTLCKYFNISADTILGLTDKVKPLYIDVADHAFILGAAGTGKTATIKHLQEVLSKSLSDDIE